MSSRPISVRALPLALVAAVLAATACGPISIDVAPIPTPKPGGPNATPSPGTTAAPSPGATRTPTPFGSLKPTATPDPNGTPPPNGTPDPNATVDPNATIDPNASPTPFDGTASPAVGASATPYPYPSTGGGTGTPKPWPSAVDLPGGTPVQGEVYEVKRDAGKPTDVAVDDKGVAWIALGQFNYSGDPPKGELVRMDKDGTPLQVLTLEGNPKRVEAAPGGGVWVLMDVKSSTTSMVNPAIVRLSADAKVLSRLDLGYGGGGSSGNESMRLVNGAGGNLWVKTGQSWSGAQVYKIAAGGGLLGTYKNADSSTYGNYGGIGVDAEGYGWISETTSGSSSSAQIVRIAPNMTKADDYAPGVDHGAYEIAATGDRVWLAFQKEIAVWKLDGTREYGIPTGYPVLQMRSDGLGGMWALTSTGGYDSHSNSVIHFDKGGDPSASFAVGPNVRGYGIGGDGAIWAANYDAATVTRVPTR